MMPKCDLLLRGLAASRENVGDAFLSDLRLGHDGDELTNDGFVLINHRHRRQRGKEDSAKATKTSLREGDVRVG